MFLLISVRNWPKTKQNKTTTNLRLTYCQFIKEETASQRLGGRITNRTQHHLPIPNRLTWAAECLGVDSPRFWVSGGAFSGLHVMFTTFLCSVWEDQLPREAAAVRDTKGTQLPLAMVPGIIKGGHEVTTNTESAWGPSKETYWRTQVPDPLWLALVTDHTPSCRPPC